MVKQNKTPKVARVWDIVFPGGVCWKVGGQTTVRVDSRVASLLRRAAKGEVPRRTMSEVLEDMLILYVQQKHPEWKLSFHDEEPS